MWHILPHTNSHPSSHWAETEVCIRAIFLCVTSIRRLPRFIYIHTSCLNWNRSLCIKETNTNACRWRSFKLYVFLSKMLSGCYCWADGDTTGRFHLQLFLLRLIHNPASTPKQNYNQKHTKSSNPCYPSSLVSSTGEQVIKWLPWLFKVFGKEKNRVALAGTGSIRSVAMTTLRPRGEVKEHSKQSLGRCCKHWHRHGPPHNRSRCTTVTLAWNHELSKVLLQKC